MGSPERLLHDQQAWGTALVSQSFTEIQIATAVKCIWAQTRGLQMPGLSLSTGLRTNCHLLTHTHKQRNEWKSQGLLSRLLLSNDKGLTTVQARAQINPIDIIWTKESGHEKPEGWSTYLAGTGPWARSLIPQKEKERGKERKRNQLWKNMCPVVLVTRGSKLSYRTKELCGGGV